MNRRPFLTVFSLLLFVSLAAQQNDRIIVRKCGTIQHLEQNQKKNAFLRQKF
jgi:hypothetical protein